MAREGYLILDSDLHMMEPDDLWVRYLDEPYRSAAQKPGAPPALQRRPGARFRSGLDLDSDGHRRDRRRRDVRHPRTTDPVPRRSGARLRGGIGARLQQLGRRLLQERPAAAQIRRADRHDDVPMAVAEARRCVIQLGAVAVIGTPNPVNGQHLHDEACEPLWDELERLDVPIGFHPTGTTALRDDAGRRYVGHANFHPIAHAIRNPVELMGAIASLTTGGVLERHPKLRAAFLEGTAGWLYWWLWRLDDQWEKFGPGCERQLSMLPSEYFKRQCYIALDVDEEPAVDVVNKVGPEYFVVSSDYPHSDGAFPEAIQQFLSLPLSGEARRKILWDNCARLYAIETPAMPLTQEQKTVSAAE